MEERQVSIDGVTRPLPEPFFVIATQNPTEQIGAYPLPESQLDRFLMSIELGYPDAAAERELLISGDRRAHILDLEPTADPATLMAWQREAAAVHVAPALLDYVQALLAASRTSNAASSRARRITASRREPDCCWLPRRAPGRCSTDGPWCCPRTCRLFSPRSPAIASPAARAPADRTRRLCCAPSRCPDVRTAFLTRVGMR